MSEYREFWVWKDSELKQEIKWKENEQCFYVIEKSAFTELERQLEELSKNCISLSLHESRVWALEKKIAEQETMLHEKWGEMVDGEWPLIKANLKIDELESNLKEQCHLNSISAEREFMLQKLLSDRETHMLKVERSYDDAMELNDDLRKYLAERDAEILQLKEIISYLPKVPTQPYEKEMAKDMRKLIDAIKPVYDWCRVEGFRKENPEHPLVILFDVLKEYEGRLK